MELKITKAEFEAYYPDTVLDEATFNSLHQQVAYKLDTVTHGRYRDVSTVYVADKVKHCIAELIRCLAVNSAAGKGIKSISNDGYSESYGSTDEVESDMRGIIWSHLSGTGLLGFL